MGPTPQREFHVVLIKPAHYDDDGYPIQWFRSAIPSNTLACLNGLAMDAQAPLKRVKERDEICLFRSLRQEAVHLKVCAAARRRILIRS